MAIYWLEDPRFEPFQIVTHMFVHNNQMHLLFNMFALYMFGSMVEHTIGSKRFLSLYFSAGLGAVILHQVIMFFQHSYYGVNAFGGAAGASGAVMGVLVSFAVLFPNARLMLLFPPIPIKAKYLALALVAIDLFFGISGVDNNVGNWAHLGGALTGFLLTLYWFRRRR